LKQLKLHLLLVCFRMKVVELSAPKTELLLQRGDIRNISRVFDFVLFVVDLLLQLIVPCLNFFKNSFVALL